MKIMLFAETKLDAAIIEWLGSRGCPFVLGKDLIGILKDVE